MTDKHDFVCSSSPMDSRLKNIKVSSEQGEVELKTDYATLVLLKSARLLKQDGVGIFAAPNGLFFSIENKPSVFKSLPKFGLYLESILSIPKSSYRPNGGVFMYLYIIRKGQNKKLFVGALTSDSSARTTIMKNIKFEKEGKEPELGMLVEPSAFRSVEALFLDRKIVIIAKSAGLTPYPIRSIASIRLAKSEQSEISEEFEEKPNSVYLPLTGNSPAVASLNDLQIEPHNYVQITIDSKVVLATYVAQFYNSNLGLLVRYRDLIGFIPELNKTPLLESTIYLPDLETQMEIVRTQSIISDIETQIEISKRDLWNNPRRAKEIYKKVRALNQANAFEAWVESSPFPLASILWAYNAELDPQNKALHLLHFFEALAELLTIISLSAFSSNK